MVCHRLHHVRTYVSPFTAKKPQAVKGSQQDAPGNTATFLILDGELNWYPWESMGFLQDKQPMCRVPHISTISEVR